MNTANDTELVTIASAAATAPAVPPDAEITDASAALPALSRRALLCQAGKAAAGLAALALLPSSPAGAATPLERLLPGVRELGRFVHPQQALGDTLPDLQLPFWGDGALWDQPQYYETIQLADIDGDGQAELTIRGPVAQLFLKFDKDTGQWLPMHDGPGFSDAHGWDQPKYYQSIRFGDIDHDGAAEMIGRDADGVQTWKYDKDAQKWNQLGAQGVRSPQWKDSDGWDRIDHYETIQLADVDGDGAAELCGRGPQNSQAMQFWKFDTASQLWQPLPMLQSPSFPDAGGWNQPQHYRSLGFADIDADGQAELLGRGPDSPYPWLRGIFVFKYGTDASGNKGWDQISVSTPPWTDNGNSVDGTPWAQGQYLATIRSGPLAGAADPSRYPNAKHSPALLLGRDKVGIQLWQYFPQSGGWWQIARGPLWSDGSSPIEGTDWSRPEYYDTIRTADIDGDGQHELLGRGKAGLQVWKYHPEGDRWSQMPGLDALSDAAGWNKVQYYSTIRLADIDGDGAAELIARDQFSVKTWKYDTTSQSWKRTSAAFPDFSTDPNKKAAYDYLNTALRGSSAQGEFRSVYYNATASLDTYYTDLDNNHDRTGQPFSPPAPVSAADWQAVKAQIQSEVRLATHVKEWYTQIGTIINDTFLSESLTLTDVGHRHLEIPDNSKAQVVLTVLMVLFTAAGKVLDLPGLGPIAGLEASTAASIAGGLASAFTVGISILPDGGAAYPEAYDQLTGKLKNAFQAALNGNGFAEKAVMLDFGLLAAIGELVDSGRWAIGVDETGPVVRAAQRSYETSLFKMLTPLAWAVNHQIGKQDHLPADYRPYSVYQNPPVDRSVFLVNPQAIWPTIESIKLANLQHVFDPPSSKASDALGESISDAVYGRNGWHIPPFGHPQAQPPASPAGRPDPELEVTAALARDAAGQVELTVQLRNGGPSGLTNVAVTAARLGRFDTTTSLPSRHTRLWEGSSHTLTLRFPGTVGEAGQSAVLRLSGSYLGGTFGASLRLTLP